MHTGLPEEHVASARPFVSLAGRRPTHRVEPPADVMDALRALRTAQALMDDEVRHLAPRRALDGVAALVTSAAASAEVLAIATLPAVASALVALASLPPLAREAYDEVPETLVRGLDIMSLQILDAWRQRLGHAPALLADAVTALLEQIDRAHPIRCASAGTLGNSQPS